MESFKDNPLEHCKRIYDESYNRVRQLHEKNVENNEFYEGIDKNLQEREADKQVVRSAIFVHQLSPAVDSRIGDMVSALEERKCPVTIAPTDESVPEDAKNMVEKLAVKLNKQLRESGYIADVFQEQVLAAEIFTTPSAVKVGWRTYTEEIPSVEGPSEQDLIVAAARGIEPTERVTYQTVERGEPFVEWLRPEEFLYEPNISLFPKDASYAGHRMTKTKDEILQMCVDFGWDYKKAKDYFDNYEAEKGDSPTTQSVIDEVEAEHGTPFDEKREEDKHILVDWSIEVFDEESQQTEIRNVVVLGNKVILKNDPDPYHGLLGMKFPYVIAISHRRLGTVENMSSIDKGKDMQRLYNESFNSFIDGLTYRIFPPFKKSRANSFAEQAVYGPGRIWSLDDPADLTPVIENPGQMPDLPALMAAIGGQIRDTLGQPDIAEGVEANQYEKATKTRLRAMGTARRASPIRKQYGMVIVRVAKMFIALNQAFGSDAVEWVLPFPFDVDVPSLTMISDPEQDKQDSLLLYSQMAQDPMFASPNGQRKRRNAWEDVVRKFKKTDVDRYTLTEQELEQDLQVQQQMQLAQLKKQAVSEQMAMASQGEQSGVSVQQQGTVPQ